MLLGNIGGAFGAAGKVLEMNGGGAGIMAKQVRPGLPREFSSRAAMLGKFRGFVKELNMRQARDLNEKQVEELQKVRDELKRMNFETVGF